MAPQIQDSSSREPWTRGGAGAGMGLGEAGGRAWECGVPGPCPSTVRLQLTIKKMERTKLPQTQFLSFRPAAVIFSIVILRLRVFSWIKQKRK